MNIAQLLPLRVYPYTLKVHLNRFFVLSGYVEQLAACACPQKQSKVHFDSFNMQIFGLNVVD